jgi:hypothetical protein
VLRWEEVVEWLQRESATVMLDFNQRAQEWTE